MADPTHFYVCLYKDSKDDEALTGHAVSNADDFPPTAEAFERSLEADTSEIEEPDPNDISERFRTVFYDFSNSMIGFVEMLPLIAGVGHVISKNVSVSAIKSYVSKNGTLERSDKTQEVYKIPIELYTIFENILQRRNNAINLGRQIPKMMILGVVSSFEHHLSQLMKEILKSRPEIINTKTIELTLKDLTAFDSLESMKSHYIDAQVEHVMRENFSKQVETFEKYLGIKNRIKDSYPSWNSLVELFERRNLFAHANGVVNKMYLNNVGSANHRVGDVLHVGPKYFSEAISNLFEFGVKLIFVAWRREAKSDLALIDDELGDFCYSLLEAKQYKLASRLLEFSLGDAAPCTQKRRMMNIVSLANSYRLAGDKAKSIKALDEVDWSAAGDEFQICVASIRGELDAVLQQMRLVSTEKISAFAYESWPVFYRLRNDKKFEGVFAEVFGRPYSPVPEDRHSFMDLLALMQEDAERAKRSVDSRNANLAGDPK